MADIDNRLAAAPISWGVCEVPGWGHQLAPERVFSEIASLGIKATELGPIGYLPFEAPAIREALDRHDLRLVGGFVPLVLHEPTLDTAEADKVAAVLAAAGAEVFNAAVVADAGWSPPLPLDDDAWKRLARHLAEVERRVAQHGLTLALHPHVGTQIETAADVERALALTEVGWCLDTGHLMIGGTDPAAFARAHSERVTHVHLKDIDAAIAAALMGARMSLVEATQAGLFVPLGHGAAGGGRIAETLQALDEHGYDGWLVLEQDTAITADEPAVTSASMLAAKQSIAFLNSAHRTEEINR